jgi:hypothetical protein
MMMVAPSSYSIAERGREQLGFWRAPYLSLSLNLSISLSLSRSRARAEKQG